MLHQILYFVKYESIFNSTPKIDIISKNVTRFTNLFEKKTHPTKTYIFLYINKLNEFPNEQERNQFEILQNSALYIEE